MSDALWTALASFGHLVSVIVLVRLVALRLGPVELGAFYLTRRVTASLLPLTTLGMDVALPRFLPETALDRTRGVGRAAFVLTLVTSTLVLALSAGFFLVLPGGLDPGRFRSLILAGGLLLAGDTLFYVLYCYLRGIDLMKRANILSLVIRSVLPVAIAAGLVGRWIGITGLVVALAAISLGAALFVGGSTLVERRRPLFKGSLANARSLLRFGITRVPAAFGRGILLTLGPVMAPIVGNLEDAGEFAVGQSMLRSAEAAILPFALVVLPRASRHIARGNESVVARGTADLMSLLLHMGLFASLQILVWSDDLVRLWLGEAYLDAVPTARVLVVGLVPYVAYALLSGVVDAVEVRALNTRHLAYGVATAVVTVLVLAEPAGATGIAVATTLGWMVTTGLTVRWIAARLDVASAGYSFVRVGVMNFVAAAMAWGVHESDLPETARAAGAIAIGVGYVLVLAKVVRPRWMTVVRSHLRSRNPAR